MDAFKTQNMKLAISGDWNYPSFVTRRSGDGAKLRRYARRKLKQQLQEERKTVELAAEMSDAS